MQENDTHLHQSAALLAPAFLVSSTPNSRPTGKIETLHVPMTTKSTKRAGALSSRTAQMSESQVAPMMGVMMRTASARWCVKTRSKRGEVIIAARMPERRRAAPYGCCE